MVATTTPHSWPIKRLFELKEGGTSGRLLIPIFQRGLVWDERRRKELIASIQLGHPIGSILIWERTLDNEKQYHLIDGLQRTNSIFTYLESPLVDFDPEWLDGPELENFVRAITTDGTDPDQIFKNQVIAHFKAQHSTGTISLNPLAITWGSLTWFCRRWMRLCLSQVTCVTQ